MKKYHFFSWFAFLVLSFSIAASAADGSQTTSQKPSPSFGSNNPVSSNSSGSRGKALSETSFSLFTIPEKVQQHVKTMPRWAMVTAAVSATLLIIVLLWLIRRLLIALVIGPAVVVVVAGVGWFILNNYTLNLSAFFTFLLSPLTVWQVDGQGLPAVAWLIGGLVGGMIVGSVFQSFFAGTLIPFISWILIRQPIKLSDLGGGREVEILAGAAADSQGDLLTLLAATLIGTVLGSLLLPHRKQTEKPRQSGRMYDYFDDDDNTSDGDD